MPELYEPARYAEGPEIVERASCRVLMSPAGIGAWFVALLVCSLLSGYLAAFYAPRAEPEAVMAGLASLCAYCLFLGYRASIRVEADGEGLQWRSAFGLRNVPWAGVRSYYLRWPLADPDRFTVGIGRRWKYLQFATPDQLTATIVTTAGTVHLGGGWPGREPLCRMVRQKATGAAEHRWEAVEYRIAGESRVFANRVPSRRTVAGLLLYNRLAIIFASQIVTFSLFYAFWSSLSPMRLGSPVPMFALYAAEVAGGCVVSTIDIMIWRRQCRVRWDETVTVTATNLIWAKGPVRRVANWSEIVELKKLPEWSFDAPRHKWRVRTQEGEMVLFLSGLQNGLSLPAIIYARSPHLWDRAAPIAEPGGPPAVVQTGPGEAVDGGTD